MRPWQTKLLCLIRRHRWQASSHRDLRCFAFVITRLTADATIISDSEPLTLSAVYPQHRQASRPVQVLVEFLRERLDEANGVL